MSGAGGPFYAVAVLAFWAVLIAELVGDKSMYALASLGLRFRWSIVFVAFVIASALKMLAAVVLGNVIMRFDSRWTYLVSALAFFVSAALVWVDEPAELAKEERGRGRFSSGALLCFSCFFFSEWGDPGQIAAAAMVLRSHQIVATWIGATAALAVKGTAALTLGMQMRHRLPATALRILASASCVILGIMAIGKM